jgi:hypothetical protein
VLRRITIRLLTLLLCSLCACRDESVDATAVRFAVYSDAELSSVRAVLLDGSGNVRSMHDFPVPGDAGSATDARLFMLDVERTERSSLRSWALVRFEGYRAEGADSKLVLHQTVRADFADNQTRLVRIWLARTCVSETAKQDCSFDMPCDYVTGQCRAGVPEVGGEPYSGTAAESWRPDDYAAPHVDASCSAGDAASCGGGAPSCELDLDSASCEFSPKMAEISLAASFDLVVPYLRKVVSDRRVLVAIGANFEAAGGDVQLFAASDTGLGPGVVLAQGTVPVKAAARDRNGVLRGSEFRVEPPIALSQGIIWIGLKPIHAGVVQSLKADATIGVFNGFLTGGAVPANGGAMPDFTPQHDPAAPQPYVYAIVSQ